MSRLPILSAMPVFLYCLPVPDIHGVFWLLITKCTWWLICARPSETNPFLPAQEVCAALLLSLSVPMALRLITPTHKSQAERPFYLLLRSFFCQFPIIETFYTRLLIRPTSFMLSRGFSCPLFQMSHLEITFDHSYLTITPFVVWFFPGIPWF